MKMVKLRDLLIKAIKADAELHRWACASLRYNTARENQAIDFRAKIQHLFDVSLNDCKWMLNDLEEELNAN